MVAILAGALLQPMHSSSDPGLHFENVTAQSGLDAAAPRLDAGPASLIERVAGGVAVADVDQDGDPDLYVVRPGADSLLFFNEGVKGFRPAEESAGVARSGVRVSGPLFFDYDNDAWPDLFVGATEDDAPVLFRNRGDGSFDDVTDATGLAALGPTMSATAADYDGDGDLDLFVSRWGYASGLCHLLQNERGHFHCVDQQSGLSALRQFGALDDSFTANFVDLDADGLPELLLSSDFGTSSAFRNLGAGRFTLLPRETLTDENGMGAAIGDFDGDGREDWFVSSVYDADGVAEGDWGTSGNRLYRNLGDGSFADATDAAGVREGGWGWAACFADLDLDGRLDLVHVNGWPEGAKEFRDTRAPLFMARPDGRFVELGAELGFDEHADGRGLSCLDYDLDGDLDLLVAHRDGSLALWRNVQPEARLHYLEVALQGPASLPSAVGARLELRSDGRLQVRSVRAGSNFASQDPLMVHFGIGTATRIESLRVHWPDGSHSELGDLAGDQLLSIQADAPPARARGCSATH